MQKILRINKSCKYFPCHKELEDCTFCYCPFYPCLNDELGEYVSSKDGLRRIWSCKDCSWIHKKKVVDDIIRQVKNLSPNPYKNDFKFKSKNVGIIILGHGSRRKQTNVTIDNVIKQLKKKCGKIIIEPSYLQLSNPSLGVSVKKIIAKGCNKIIIVPFFLFIGNHVARDIPKEIRRQRSIYKDVKFIFAKNIGSDPRISNIVLDCINGAVL